MLPSAHLYFFSTKYELQLIACVVVARTPARQPHADSLATSRPSEHEYNTSITPPQSAGSGTSLPVEQTYILEIAV
jgi:hypothetical protein